MAASCSPVLAISAGGLSRTVVVGAAISSSPGQNASVLLARGGHGFCGARWKQSGSRGWTGTRIGVEKDPFVEFSSGFSEDSEEPDAEGGMSPLTQEEKDAIIAFETGQSLPTAEGDESDENQQQQKKTKKEIEVGFQAQEADAPRVKTGKGQVIRSMCSVYMQLLERPSSGDGRMIAAAGSAVVERLEAEVETLMGEEGVNEQSLFEILRAVHLMEMDLQLVAAARKDTTLRDRLDQTLVHCKQAYEIANSL